MHLIPTTNSHNHPLSFERFMILYSSISQNQDQSFNQERWYVLSECAKHLYSVVVYFCTFNKCIIYHAQRVQ
jgi:hypothetical protein